MTKTYPGSCLCGGVQYEVSGELRPVTACHCSQCRKTTGHYFATTAAALSDFKLLKEETLAWYRASDFASRGFCNKCGASLFWQRDDGDYISILAGTLDGETGLNIRAHIFCADKGDYYEIPENEGPQYPGAD